MTNFAKGHFEYSLIGTGAQSIVFLNGYRMKFDCWDKVCANISNEYRIFLYNRRGVGASCKASVKQTGHVIIDELHGFLSKLEIKSPRLLVAHSLGGIYANLYARTFSNDVSGVVFVDSPHPSEIIEQRNFQPPLLLRVVNEGIKRIEKIFDPLKYSEDECIEETVVQIQSAGPFPDVPVTVISGTKKMPFVPQVAFDAHLRCQEKLLDLAERSRQIKCIKSGHFPQVTEPEKVAHAIEETAHEARLT